MRSIKYVGPFLTVAAEGITFTRHIYVDVPSPVAEKLLAAKLAGELSPAFVEKAEEVVSDAA